MPKIVDKDQKRKDIAHAAIKVLAEKGFEGSTIADIAKAAGVGKGTIYEYFDTKEEIIIEVSMQLFSEMDNVFGEDFLRINDPRKKITELITGVLKFTSKMKDIMMVYMEIWRIHMRGNQHGVSMMVLKDALVMFRQLVASIITEGQQKNIFKKNISAESLALFLVASLDGVGMHYLLDEKNFDIDKITTDFLDVLFMGMEA